MVLLEVSAFPPAVESSPELVFIPSDKTEPKLAFNAGFGVLRVPQPVMEVAGNLALNLGTQG